MLPVLKCIMSMNLCDDALLRSHEDNGSVTLTSRFPDVFCCFFVIIKGMHGDHFRINIAHVFEGAFPRCHSDASH